MAKQFRIPEHRPCNRRAVNADAAQSRRDELLHLSTGVSRSASRALLYSCRRCIECRLLIDDNFQGTARKSIVECLGRAPLSWDSLALYADRAISALTEFEIERA
jgi:hypothetical protein